MRKLFWLGAGVLALSACAIRGDVVMQDITVMTSPAGADCSLTRNGILLGQVGPTPGHVLVRNEAYLDIVVRCSLRGYDDAVRSIGRNQAGQGYENPVQLAMVANSMSTPGESKSSRMPGAALGDLANEGDANLILRFQTLERLFDEGLITREEYNRRRGANLGALLRYTAPPAAIDLSRSAPRPQQVVDRLRYLAQAFEEKSISAREQAAERAIILEALLPATPRMKADPPPPITDEMQAAAAVGRLERLVLANVVNAKEMSREKDAIFRAVRVARASAEAAVSAAVGMLPPAVPSRGPGVRLGSYPSENQARLAWASLQLTHASELGSLQPEIKSVRLRRGGRSYSLSAGVLSSRKAAADLCKTLRSRRQSCSPTVVGK